MNFKLDIIDSFKRSRIGAKRIANVPRPGLERKGMRAIFRKKGKKRAKKGKIFENFGKNIQNLKIF